MATITASGVGSGLDINAIISQLMAAEQQPLTNIDAKAQKIDARISAYGKISSALSSLLSAAKALNTPTTIGAFTATLSDTTLGTATASTSAAAGAYTLNVTNLAKAHTLYSTSYGGSTTVVGDGSLQITSGSNTFNVTIDNTNHTLEGIRDAINASSSNTSVAASIVTDANGARLVLSAKNTGSTNAISVVVTESGAPGLAQLSYTAGAFNLSEATPAQNAQLTINGIPISSATKTISSAITGVTLNLTKDSGTATLTVARDSEGIKKAAETFASAYSKLVSQVKSLTAFDSSTNTGSTLSGDGTTSLVMTRIRSTLGTVPTTLTGIYTTLSEVGISIQSDGSMSVNSAKLQTAIDNNFTDLKDVLGGYGKAVADAVDDLTDNNGAVTTRVASLTSSLHDLARRRLDVQDRLARIEANYRRQFSALDALVASMNSTGSFLTQQLARL